MSSYYEQLPAGEVVRFVEKGAFFRLRSSAGPVDVRYYLHNKLVADAAQVEAGYSEVFDHPGFDRIDIISVDAQAVRFDVRESSRVNYDRSVGAVDIINRPIVEVAAFSGSRFEAADTVGWEAVDIPDLNSDNTDWRDWRGEVDSEDSEPSPGGGGFIYRRWLPRTPPFLLIDGADYPRAVSIQPTYDFHDGITDSERGKYEKALLEGEAGYGDVFVGDSEAPPVPIKQSVSGYFTYQATGLLIRRGETVVIRSSAALYVWPFRIIDTQVRVAVLR